MKQFHPSKLIILVALLSGLNWSAFAQITTYNYTGAAQSYSVPAGVTAIGIDMYGGCGGYAYVNSGTNPVSLGGRVQCTLNVTPLSTIYVYVGQAGPNWTSSIASTGGWNGGGGGGSFAADGGGASDLRTSTSGYSAANIIAVAGAGGGGGDFSEIGGAGGGTTGASGTGGACGGSQTGPGCTTGHGTGTQGQGNTAGVYSSGGGGGGWWGGNSGTYTDGGGGGGSSYPLGPGGGSGASAMVTAIVHTQGYAAANGSGKVTITVLCNSPGTIVGNVPFCSGTTLALSDPGAVSGGTWSSSGAAITINPSTGLVTGVSAGTGTVTYTIGNPCGGTAALATATVTVNQSPTAVLGSSSVCVGSVTTLSDGVSGGTWTSGSLINATIDPASGYLSGISTGGASSTAVTITYTLPGGCFTTTTEAVRSTPNIFTISPVSAAYCSGTTSGPTLPDIELLGSTIGVSYQLLQSGSPYGGPQPGTGSTIDFGSHAYPAGAYTVIATDPTSLCTATMSGAANIIINPLPSPITGSPNVCIGSTITLSDPTPGGTWSSSNTAVAAVGVASGMVTGYVAGSPTITYTLSSGGCKTYLPIAVNTAPPAIGGTLAACIGGTSSLTDASAGGTWTTSDATVAPVGVSTGVVSGVAAGSVTITYASSLGCTTSSAFVVNPLPTPYTLTVSGGGSFCDGGSGVHVGLSYSSSGVNYQLYNGGSPVGFAVEGSNSGLDFGLQSASGSYTVIGTNILSGCNGNMTGSATITIKPLPDQINSITGGGSYCASFPGVPVGTSGSIVGVKYQLYNGSVPASSYVLGTGLSLSFGIVTTPGTYTVMATSATTGCSDALSSDAVVSIAPPPTIYAIGGGGSFCAGGAGAPVTLSNSDAGTIYQLYKGGVASGSAITSFGGPLSFPLTTTPGVYTIQATDGTSGCNSNMSGSVTIVVDPLPTPANVTGSGAYCIGAPGLHVGLDFGGAGITYVLMNSSGVIVDSAVGTGSGLDFGVYGVGNYTSIGINTASGCTNTMTGSAVITEAALPTVYPVTGGGNFCLGGAGVSVLLTGSDAGVNYQLYKGTTPIVSMPGTGSGGINFGIFTAPGAYTVVATNPGTTCVNNMADSAVISVSPLPVAYSVTGGGNFCIGGTGADVQLSGSSSGVSYDLYVSGTLTPLFTVTGTGSLIDFGLQTGAGSYTVVGTDIVSSCVKNMSGGATIVINSLPVVHNVTGGGTGCAGGPGFDISLDGSSTGVSYQVWSGSVPSGSPIAGSGGPLDLGPRTASGTYTVVAVNPLTSCTDNMSGSAMVNVIPLPNTYPICGGGNFCAGSTGADVLICTGSDPGVNYQLYVGGTPTGVPVTGTGGPVDFGNQTSSGIYTIVATNSSGCNNNMPGSVLVNPVSPTLFTVTGGGNYCVGGAGQDVSLNGSSPGVSYQLYLGGATSGTAVTGTGAPLDFGLQTGAGLYTVVATTTPLGCTATMSGSGTVGINSLPGVETVTGNGGYCIGGSGLPVGLSSSEAGINYQLYFSGFPSGPALISAGGAISFGLKTAAGSYSVVATNPVTTCASNMADSVTISIQPAPTAYAVTVTDSGFYCAVGTGVSVGLANSDLGVNYQLYRSSTAIGSPIAGTGSSLVLGLEAVAGTYRVTGAAAGASSCNGNMAGSVSVNIVPLPAVHNVTGGGSYCPGAEGVDVGLDGSNPGITYTLYRGTTLETMLYGTGYPLDFGIQTVPGTYSVVGNSTITTCPNNMYGTPAVYIDTLTRPIATLRAYPGNNVGVWHIDSVKVFVSNGGPNPTFQWYVNGNLIPGATNATFVNYTFFNNDSVACTVTASGPCGELSTTESLIVSLHNVNVGVSQVTSTGGDVMLLPNPNKGAFTLKGSLGSSLDQEVTIEVTNMLGQVVYTNKVMAPNGSLDEHIQLGNELANGMYILNLHSGSENTVFHFVIEQ